MESLKASRRASVITSEAAAGGGLALRTLQINDIVQEAGRLLKSAREEASALLADARARGQAEVAALRAAALKDAHAQGYKAGHDEGFTEGRAAGLVQALNEARQDFSQKQNNLALSCAKIIDDISKDRTEWLRIAREDLIDLAITLANRVVHCIGERDREVVQANLEQVIRLVGARTDVTIAVNPIDAATARTFAQSLLDGRQQWQNVQVIEEPEVSPGGCRVRWGSGAADATLETQFERIVAELKGESGAGADAASP